MKSFDFVAAWHELALPAVERWNEAQKHIASLVTLVKNERQRNDLTIKTPDMIAAEFRELSDRELAELAVSAHDFGHWIPGKNHYRLNVSDKRVFSAWPEFSPGAGWKLSNMIDQCLRSRLKPPHYIQIHEGKIRITYSDKNCWLWQEVGLATSENLEKVVQSKLPFTADDFDKTANTLRDMCGDLWDTGEYMRENGEYERNNAEREIRELPGKIREEAEKAKEEAEREYTAATWLLENGKAVLYPNMIYYSHTGRFCFGWRESLKSNPPDLTGFPFDYDIK